MIEAHFKKLRKRDDISAEEEKAIRGAVSEVRKFPADVYAIRAGEELNVSMLLLDGWLARAKDLRGGARQISELHVAGDFADLHSFTLKRLDHDVLTLTRCTIAVVPHDRLKQITERHPHLTRVYWFSTNLDAAIQRWVIIPMDYGFWPFAATVDLLLLVPLAGYDLRTLNGRLHPATIRGTAVLLSSEAVLFALWGTSTWHTFALAVGDLIRS